ncbi:MAG: T9SS type A sorting domain-containing protein [Bacteroidetes bacterium]|nr:T9SS type A sorting domain-containing protein [Bacteroidota bacterium]
MKGNLYPLFLLVCCLLAGLGLQAQTPVASYNFSGQAKDQSSFANHASIRGATLTQDRFGWSNSAFYFDGQQSGIRAANAAQLNSANATISFWVNPEGFPAQGEAYLLSFGGWQERFKISLPSHGKPVFTTHANGACCSDMDSGTPLTIGTWTHVVMTHDGAKDIIYFNGVQVNEKNVAGALDATTHPLGIGYDPIDIANYFNGSIDDVQLYDVALDASQVAALFATQSAEPSVPQGKVAEYVFNNNGADVTDFGNHADVSNSTFTTDRFGFGKSALLCNGQYSEAVASNASQLNSDVTTISFWVKVNSLPGNGESFLLSYGGWQERFKISLPTHGKPVFTTNHSNGISDMDSGNGNELPVGVWKHLVFVHDGAKDKIFIDGVLKAEKNVVGTLNSTTKPLGIGYNPIDGGNWFDGAIDELAIYNTALSDSEISSLYAAQSAFPGTPNELVAVYHLNGNGEDASGLHNDAVVSETATAVANRHNWASNALSGYATADNSAALQSDYTTISFWVKPNSFPGSGEVFLLSNGGWQERWKISLPGHGKPVFTTHSGGACCSDLDSGTPLALNTWTHVVMVHDGTKDIIYINGAQANEKNAAGALDKTKHPLGIGYDPIDNGGFFDGSLDDVKVFNRALSAAEIAALYATQSVAPVIPGNLVADYKSSGNAHDATGYENHATVQGAQLTTDRFGKSNMAYAFNGVDQSLVAANSPQQNSAFTTISFWIKPAAFPASGEAYVLSNGGWQERWKISLPSHGKPVFTTHSNGACCSDLDSGTPLALNTWTHVVMTHDGAKDIIYFNGVQVNEKNTAGSLDATTHPLGIGYDPIDNNYFFQGSLDEVQLYNVALNATEVAALYAAQSAAPANTDAEAPCAPLNLQAAVIFNNVELFWLPAMDNVAVTAYNVYQDGALIGTVTGTLLSVPELTPLTEYEFGVTAVDAAGNESLPTTRKVTTGVDETPDTTPPTAPGNLSGTAASNSVLVTWDASTDDTQVAGYVILVDGVVFDTVSGTTLSIFIGGLDPLTLYTFEVYAFDLAGNNSPVSELTLSTSQPIDTGEPGMVAHYPFDGNANDATPYQNHGAIGGNPTFITADHPNGGGQAIRFDGDQDSVLVPNAVQLISDYATVSFWIRVDDTNLQDAEAYVIDFGHWNQRWKISLPQHLKIVWTTNGNNIQFPNFISDMDSGDGNEMVKTFWWYVTMVHDGTSDIIYVNGQQANIKPVNTKLNSTSLPLCFGNNPVEGGQYFIGALDNVKLYNKALTADEILNLYVTGTTGTNDQFENDLHGVVLGVSPNPAVDVLHVQHAFNSTQALQVRIFDLAGRQVGDQRFGKNEIPAGQFPIDVHNLPKGTYMLNFVFGGKNLGSVQFSKQ